jgi:dienelactone hydrolase
MSGPGRIALREEKSEALVAFSSLTRMILWLTLTIHASRFDFEDLTMLRASVLALFLVPAALLADTLTLFTNGKKPADRRLTTVRSLNDKDFFLRPPANLNVWEARKQAVREQILVATGLWPLPPRTALKPTIHGKIIRDGYTVEKVFFSSHPGHYVCGNLYRPTDKDGKPLAGKRPGVLCPHGHWRNGRFYDAGEAAAKAQIDKKAEKTMEGARYPLQARCAQLARMGCVVFHYDMVGYADSKSIGHSAFSSVEAELRLQNLMGLQTWNSIRSLDFLSSLPDVDAKRIGVTGASGGGTQTFILCALDSRPAAAFPAVMVSTQMQGGCVCENCSYLRIGTGNVEFAGLFAPRPLGMSGADDWTKDIERKGLPELEKLYKLFNAGDKVMAKCYPMFEHNYNQVSRELMYGWFNKHLELKQKTPIHEKPFKPIPPAELSVFDKTHPRPADSLPAGKLLDYLTSVSDKQLEGLRPNEAEPMGEYRRILGPALRVMMASRLPAPRQIDAREQGAPKVTGATVKGFVIGRRGQGEQVPAVLIEGKKSSGTIVVWVDQAGKKSLLEGKQLSSAAKTILDKGAAILAVDVFGTGELSAPKATAVNEVFAGYTFGYNRPLLSQRVHDILTAVAFARKQQGVKKVHLIGNGKAGPWVLLARGLCGDSVARTAADVNKFRFDSVRKMTDEMMLPGALKYGGLPALAGLSAPGELHLHNQRGTGMGQWLKPAYKAAGAGDKLVTSGEKLPAEKLIDWLLK